MHKIPHILVHPPLHTHIPARRAACGRRGACTARRCCSWLERGERVCVSVCLCRCMCASDGEMGSSAVRQARRPLALVRTSSLLFHTKREAPPPMSHSTTATTTPAQRRAAAARGASAGRNQGSRRRAPMWRPVERPLERQCSSAACGTKRAATKTNRPPWSLVLACALRPTGTRRVQSGCPALWGNPIDSKGIEIDAMMKAIHTTPLPKKMLRWNARSPPRPRWLKNKSGAAASSAASAGQQDADADDDRLADSVLASCLLCGGPAGGPSPNHRLTHLQSIASHRNRHARVRPRRNRRESSSVIIQGAGLPAPPGSDPHHTTPISTKQASDR